VRVVAVRDDDADQPPVLIVEAGAGFSEAKSLLELNVELSEEGEFQEVATVPIKRRKALEKGPMMVPVPGLAQDYFARSVEFRS
jgi:hypothetical protein